MPKNTINNEIEGGLVIVAGVVFLLAMAPTMVQLSRLMLTPAVMVLWLPVAAIILVREYLKERK